MWNPTDEDRSLEMQYEAGLRDNGEPSVVVTATVPGVPPLKLGELSPDELIRMGESMADVGRSSRLLGLLVQFLQEEGDMNRDDAMGTVGMFAEYAEKRIKRGQ